MVKSETLLQAAKSAGLVDDPEILRSHHNLLIGTLKDRQLRPDLATAAVEESEIESYYREHQDDYLQPARVRLAAIFAAAPAQGSENQKQQARIPTEVIEVAKALETVSVSEAIDTPKDYDLAQLVAGEPATHTTLEKVRAAIVSTLLQEKRAAISGPFHAELRTKANVTTFPDRLGQIKLPDGAATSTQPTPPQF